MVFDDLLTPWLLFGAALVALLLTQRWLQRHMIGLALLATGKPDLSIILYYTVMFPGVLVHEVSHWLVARVLLVRTGRFAIWPERDAHGVRLGYIEVDRPDIVRGTLVGAAPLAAGLLITLLIADQALILNDLTAALATGRLALIAPAIERLMRRPDFWIWLYLTFTIANTMMPSREDRQAWPAFFVSMLVVLAMLAAAGLGDPLVQILAGPVTEILSLLATVFFGIVVLNLCVIALVGAAEAALSRLSGRRVDYSPASPAHESPAAPPPAQPPVPFHDRPLPVPAPPQRAPPLETPTPHTPAPVFDDDLETWDEEE